MSVESTDDDVLHFDALRSTGLLWLINASVFHPRGFALALTMRDGRAVGWSLLGDGSEPWRFGDDTDSLFAAAEELFASLRGERVTISRGRLSEGGPMEPPTVTYG
jgi:hypothetical protein